MSKPRLGRVTLKEAIPAFGDDTLDLRAEQGYVMELDAPNQVIVVEIGGRSRAIPFANVNDYEPPGKFRERVTKENLDGETCEALARKYHLSDATVRSWKLREPTPSNDSGSSAA